MISVSKPWVGVPKDLLAPRLCHDGTNAVIVILNPALSGMKNLIISTESITEILRLTPQNDHATQSPVGEGDSWAISKASENISASPFEF